MTHISTFFFYFIFIGHVLLSLVKELLLIQIVGSFYVNNAVIIAG